MNNWVTQRRLILSLLMASIQLLLSTFLQIKRILPATLDALSAHLKALIDLGQWLLLVVEAVHGAPGTLVIHNVEFLI